MDVKLWPSKILIRKYSANKIFLELEKQKMIEIEGRMVERKRARI
ncbi:hypothetical protein Thermo_01022 [Thermoplasmatales archaeon]|nr:hypothetical protein Thermo_01022 [Thermoplasmatales archaeon]